MCIRDRLEGLNFFQAEDGIRDQPRSRGLGDVYKRQGSASRILKRSAHITVVVEPKEARQARKKAKSGRPAAAAKSETEKGA